MASGILFCRFTRCGPGVEQRKAPPEHRSLLGLHFNIVWTTFGAVLDLKFLDQTMRIIHGFRVLGFGDPWAFSARLFVQPNIDKLRITHRS